MKFLVIIQHCEDKNQLIIKREAFIEAFLKDLDKEDKSYKEYEDNLSKFEEYIGLYKNEIEFRVRLMENKKKLITIVDNLKKNKQLLVDKRKLIILDLKQKVEEEK